MRNGDALEQRVEHARGSLDRPLSDRDLLGKVELLIEPFLPGRTGRLWEVVLGLGRGTGIDDLQAVLAP